MEQPKDAPPHSKRKNQALIYGKEGKSCDCHMTYIVIM